MAIAAYTISTGSTIYINYPSSGFASTSLNLNGGATVTSGGLLQLTDGSGGEGRSAWFTTEVPVQTFVTDFTFQQLNATADGMTFTIQSQGATAQGDSGGGLGYQGITPSVAVKFDLYNNDGEGIDSTGLYTDGASPTVPSVDLSSTGINLHSGDIMHAHMVYDGTNLTMTLTDTVTSAFVTEVFPVNIPSLVGNTAWVGFTGGTGGETSTQNILSWSFTSLAAAPAATPTFSPAAGTYAASQSVTISDATAGTTIYYTTNGTAPTTSSTVYTGPVTVSATETLEATAVATGYTNSATASATYTISPAVPAPTFSPAAGTYTTTQTVTISDTTAGTTIYYTTNGTTPTTSSTVYTGPITVSATETLEAIAVETGDSNAVGMATYTIAPVLPTPTFSLATGTYTTTQTITISDATAGTTIYYTTNGTTPTTSSAEYTGPITVSATETIEAKAVETGYTNSAAFSATYTIAPVLPTPTFSLATGTYTTTQTVTISDATAGTTIYYTTNGATPTTSSTLYTGPITVCASEKLQAIAVETGYTDSAAASATYTLNLPALPVPSFSLAAGTYAKSQTVTISDATAGTTIYYTTNSTTPTTSSTPYTGPITVGETETVKAIAVETGYINSVIASASYTITPLPTPTFSVAAGTYASMQTVTISDATAGTTIYYTTDTTTPTASSTPYTGPITVSATEAVKAIAMETGYIKSAVATADYTITPLPAPTFSVAAGTYASMQTVTISDATAGTTIYYTTDTTTPTASSTQYTGPITVSATEALKAIAMETGYIKSAVATADYTITPLPAPTFSVAAGTYTTTQTVTISDATAGTTIYYTTDATTPTASSTQYTGPITVGATETVKAIAVETGCIKSAVATADYTINTGGTT
ncbi:MAG: chitobiase/beta-hexosaminidase C-terminal domain-containing protein [Terracidiphilus sp.]